MKGSKKFLMVLVAVAMFGMILWVNGCKKEESTSNMSVPTMNGNVELCSKCGQIKGSDLCCKAGQEKCPKCGLAKGSPGCCKLPE